MLTHEGSPSPPPLWEGEAVTWSSILTPLLGGLVLTFPAVVAVVAVFSSVHLWHDGGARQKRLAGLAIGGIGLGAVFYLLFTTWLALQGRIRVLVNDPPTGDGGPYSATLLGLGLSFLVTWLGVVHERLRLAAQRKEKLDRLDRRLRHRIEEPEESS